MKKLILLLALSLFSISLRSQTKAEKYEFMSVMYYPNSSSRQIRISMENKDFTTEEVKLGKKESDDLNTTPLLKKVKEYQDKGWEVTNLNSISYLSNGMVHFAYLRKKK